MHHVLILQTVPGNLTRYGLSQIINHLLALDPPRPFDFLIKDELLRRSLHHHMAAHALSTEAVLEIEYVPAVLPPTPKEQHPHDDWIACITPSPSPSVIAVGGYDGIVQLIPATDKTATHSQTRFKATTKGAVKAIATIPSSTTTATNNTLVLVTGGDDRRLRVWSIRGQAQLLAISSTPNEHGHSKSISSIAVNPTTHNVIASAGWDGRIAFWNIPHQRDDAGDAGDENGTKSNRNNNNNKTKKKRKTEGGAVGGVHDQESIDIDGSNKDNVSQLEATHAITVSPNYCVSSLSWPTPSTLIAASWDHTVRVYDPELSSSITSVALIDSYSHSKAIYCVASHAPSHASQHPQMIAFGGAEKTLRLWDRRAPPTTINGMALAAQADNKVGIKSRSSHRGWISSLAWHPTSPHHLASGSYDGTVKVWDIRAPVPLHTLQQQGDSNSKVLSVAWGGGGEEVVWGGEDRVLHRFAVSIV